MPEVSTPQFQTAGSDAEWLKTLARYFEKFGLLPPIELKEIYSSFNQNQARLKLLIEECPPLMSFHFGLPPAEYLGDT